MYNKIWMVLRSFLQNNHLVLICEKNSDIIGFPLQKTLSNTQPSINQDQNLALPFG